jgi:hypothetical protein
MLANFGVGNREVDYAQDWLGAPLFSSSFGAEGEKNVIRAAGFELVFDTIEIMIEDGLPHCFLLVLARNT